MLRDRPPRREPAGTEMAAGRERALSPCRCCPHGPRPSAERVRFDFGDPRLIVSQKFKWRIFFNLSACGGAPFHVHESLGFDGVTPSLCVTSSPLASDTHSCGLLPAGRLTPQRRHVSRVLTQLPGLGGLQVPGETLSRRHDCRVGSSESGVTPNMTLPSLCQPPGPDRVASVTSCHLWCWS